MKERPILFSGAMVRSILSGAKRQTRRVAPVESFEITEHDGGLISWAARFTRPLTKSRAIATHSGGRFTRDQASRIVASQFCPYGQPGDRLWVRETWQGPIMSSEEWDEHGNDSPCTLPPRFNSPAYCEYAADGGPAPEFMTADDELVCRWRPSIHMPRWASRISLDVTGVRVERLQDISETDAKAEGVEWLDHPPACPANDPARGWRGYVNHEPLYRDTARDSFKSLWASINGAESWDANPWVWVVEFKHLKGQQ